MTATKNERNTAIRGAFTRAFKDAKAAGNVPRRHRAEVTADRLTDDVIHFCDRLTGEERDAAGLIIQALREIADDERQ
jgi:hypothetical protein